MPEAEWDACTEPDPMLDWLRGEASDRKLRLFMVACCRRIWQYLPESQSRFAVESAERYADGLADGKQLHQAADAAAAIVDFDGDTVMPNQAAGAAFICAVPPDSPDWEAYGSSIHAACDVSYHAAEGAGWDAGFEAAQSGDGKRDVDESVRSEVYMSERAGQCCLLRCIFGHPFRPVTLDHTWLTLTVTGLAETIYHERAFDRLPILADALEDAGCTNADILNHCRQPGEHVRGCWVIDLLTGRQ